MLHVPVCVARSSVASVVAAMCGSVNTLKIPAATPGPRVQGKAETHHMAGRSRCAASPAARGGPILGCCCVGVRPRLSSQLAPLLYLVAGTTNRAWCSLEHNPRQQSAVGFTAPRRGGFGSNVHQAFPVVPVAGHSSSARWQPCSGHSPHKHSRAQGYRVPLAMRRMAIDPSYDGPRPYMGLKGPT